MSNFNIVALTNESTVVTEYTPNNKKHESYQSEADLEKEFISLLGSLGYEYINITNEKDLIENLRLQLETLNSYKFSDNEWNSFFKNIIASSNEGIIEKTKKIQTDSSVQCLTKDNGLTQNIKLIDKINIHNNRLQVINQYENNDGKYRNRYDVTVLVNGFPLIHIELKRRGVSIREAFNQIKRYQRDSFWASSGLFDYVQIFVISNGTYTKYYSNTVRESHIKENGYGKSKKKKTSNSFEFTSYWADSTNKAILDLTDFTKTFFAKHTILNILTKYCVFTSENLLLVMRPYQIAACERILNRIIIAANYKKYGSVNAGGYIWHTTGSGKTLTSFKTAQLASKLPCIDKVLFVVDRKDLDYQTMKEYDRFQKGATNSNTSTKILQKQLEDENSKIIITTLQKLTKFISANKQHNVYDKYIALIFDECHRSQFGESHKNITKAFKKYYIFGFTGTPIFAKNATSGGKTHLKTTPQIFGGEPNDKDEKVLPLHTYTIVDAINDKNVLPFRIDYINTIKEKPNITDKQVKAIDVEKALLSEERVTLVTDYILTHFNQKTKRNNASYHFNKLSNIQNVASDKYKGKVEEIKEKTRLSGFNSIFAVSSIPAAKLYYDEFIRQMNENPEKMLKIATIFSYNVNEDSNDEYSEENSEDTSKLDASSKDFLERAISNYNKIFNTNYDTSSDKFQNYYKDVSLRMKNKELDLLIVVNMFLTGFDATTLNTLWIDKNLKYHGLIQAFSRTNRILNSVKTYGNIVCFRDLQKDTEEAVALFGNRNAGGIVLLKSFNDYYYGYEDEKGEHKGYIDVIAELKEKYPLNERIESEENKKYFIKLFNVVLRLRNILTAFDEFIGDATISDRDLQDYQSMYLLIKDELKPDKHDKENINDDLVFEMELIRQVEINIDYILFLVAKYYESGCENKEIIVDIQKAVNSSPFLRSKKELIESFIASVNNSSHIENAWKEYVSKEKESELDNIIKEERLKPVETKTFIENSFRDGVVKTTGTDIDKILPPSRLFGGNTENNKQSIKQRVIEKLIKFFEKYVGI